MKKWMELITQNKRYMKLAAGALAVLLIGGTTAYYVVASDFSEREWKGETPFQGGGFSEEGEAAAKLDGNKLTAEGTTSVLTVDQTIEFDAGRNFIQIEAVYVEAGDTVVEGDALLKLTEESMESIIAYYNQEIKEATEAVNEAKINQETGLLEAEYTLQQTKADAESAQAAYDAALSELALSVEEKKAEYEDTQTKISAYNEAVTYNYYYDSEGMAEKENKKAVLSAELETANTELEAAKNAYTAAETTLKEAIETMKAEAATGSTTVECANALLAAYVNEQTAKTELESKQQAAQSIKNDLQTVEKEIEDANREYESKVANANNQIELLSAKLDSLQSNYEKAKREAETKKLELYKEYETNLLNGEYADTAYDTTIAELENAVTSAENTLKDLEETFAVINGMTDGILCANQSGTLATVSYEAGDVLWGNNAVVSYYDMSKVYISIEVEQEQIAKLAVGDSASVRLSGKRNALTAEIASIASEKTSGGSISNVTYTVELVMDNGDGSISAGVLADITIEL